MFLSTILTIPLLLTGLASAGTIDKRITLKECNSQEQQELQSAVTHAGEMAKLGAASIRAGNVTSLFESFFKTTDSSSMNHVATILEEIAEETSSFGTGLVTYSCSPDGLQCQNFEGMSMTGYGETNGYTGDVRTCPAYFTLDQVSDSCSVLDQRTSSLHELCHTKGVLGYEVYGYFNVLGLSSQMALRNAESYAFFSKSVYLGCAAL